jgi:hypothetical protein
MEVLTSNDVSVPSQGISAIRFNLLTDGETPEQVAIDAQTAARQLIGERDALTAFLYLEEIALQWRGWVARVELRKGGTPQVFFDNDPIAREAAYRDL